MKNNSDLLIVKNLKKYYEKRKHWWSNQKQIIRAIDDVSFSLRKKEILGLVGESGSGKSSIALTTARLIEPTAGSIIFNNIDLLNISKQTLRKLRTDIQIVFQDPFSSLNPRKTILENIGEPLLYHKIVKDKKEQIERVAYVLSQIGIPSSALLQYPHQFSGGQQQRISIGRAIAGKPKLIICDEVVSALDLSVQAQVLNLLSELHNSLNLSYLFISHDLAVVRFLCSRVLIMYKGKIVESGITEEVFSHPKHPYTELLISSQPTFVTKGYQPESQSRCYLKQNIVYTERPKPLTSGCPFYRRCPFAQDICIKGPIPLKKEKNHEYSCIL